MKKAIITILIIAAVYGLYRGSWLMGYNSAISQSRAIDTMKTSVRLLSISASANTIARDESLPMDVRALGSQISGEVDALISLLGK